MLFLPPVVKKMVNLCGNGYLQLAKWAFALPENWDEEPKCSRKHEIRSSTSND